MFNFRSPFIRLMVLNGWVNRRTVVLNSHAYLSAICLRLKRSNFRICCFGSALGLYVSYELYRSIKSNDIHLGINSVSALGVPPETPSKPSARERYNFVADVAERVSPSVVYIEIRASHPFTNQSVAVSSGSGFVIKSDGLILTNAHVVANHSNVVVKLQDGREFRGTVEDLDMEMDLATIRINVKDLPILPLGQSSKLRPGEFVIAMGNPLSLSHTITIGVVSSVNRGSKELGLHQKTHYVQTDAAINVGNSGGPLVNLDGEAIGINTMKVTEGISFAISSDCAGEFLKKVENKKKWNFFKKPTVAEVKKKSYIGVTILTLTPQIIQELQQRSLHFPSVQHGVLVWRVTLGSPAYESGIRPGDVITSVNNIKIHTVSDFFKLLNSGEALIISFVRGTVTGTSTVSPTESPS